MTTTQTSRRAWAGLAVLCVVAVLASLELTVTHLALPAIDADLRPSGTQLLWIVDVYAFLLAGSMLALGAAGDRIGRRRLLMIGAAAYGVLSALAAWAPTAETLIAARALLGVAGATLMPSTLSLTATMFRDARQRAVAVGVVIASVSGGTAIGPLVGGALLERFWWGSVFLLGVPVMVLILALGPILLPAGETTTTTRIDVASVGLSMGAVLPLVWGLKEIAAGGAGWAPVAAVAGGIVVGAAFVARQRVLADPMVDVRLFRDPAFSVAVATLATGIFVLWGANYYLAQYLQLVQDLSPLRAGLWTAPSAAGVIVGSLLAPRLARRIRPGVVIGVGLTVSAAGFVLLTQLTATSGLGLLVAGSVTVSAGLGPMMALATDQVVGAAPPERAGAAAALSSMAPQLGGALGIAVLGSVVAAVFRGAGTGADTLGAAVAAAEDGTGLAAAREAFTDGIVLAAAVSAALAAALAISVVTLSARRDSVIPTSRPPGSAA
ncbi:MFS transporter [Jiangella sp. DSM 45060]|uniref:MFS transporter n=1 Tax=Jiangella sp. DSM 45060 TaxID=1798224 RepID=UPI000879E190|nr:MFS transporter [Jiangella sp. DSM 45060]SDT68199.1 MFS transporter, DHA2 family, multidrug resistance protein [Jiangella sp. DSM 45060]